MSMILLDAALRRLVKSGTLTVVEVSGATHTYGLATPGWPDMTLRLLDKGVPGHIARHPTVGMGEVYMDGRVAIEGGDIMDFVTFIRRNNPFGMAGEIDAPGLFQRLRERLAMRLDQINARAASRRNVAHHYDLDDRLYDVFLDSNRQYSCGYWEDGVTDLETAQVDKMNHIAAKLALQPGMRVLDIGCGWGGLALHLHKVAGVEVHGITLSREQFTYARSWALREGVASKVTFGLTDYRDMTGTFDRIVSVGMFEHVGAPNFDAFFRQCHNLLRQDGVMMLHTIGRASPPGGTDAFTRKYIFPGGYIPALSETMAAIEQNRLFTGDIEVLRVHYATTLREWYRRCVAQKDAIVALYDERFYRLWQFYLAGAATAFEFGEMINYQIQLLRDREAVPITRRYIDRAERAYSAHEASADNLVHLNLGSRGA